MNVRVWSGCIWTKNDYMDSLYQKYGFEIEGHVSDKIEVYI